MSPSELLRKAAARLREHGWRQGEYGNWMGWGPCCVYGAMWSAGPVSDDTYLRASCALRGRTNGSPIKWNDTPGRTADEVIGLLERTADELEAA